MKTTTEGYRIAVEKDGVFTEKFVPQDEAEGSRIEFIHAEIGGHFDVAFTVSANDPQRKTKCLTGYVHDEGLLIPLPIRTAVRYPSGYVSLLAGPMLMQALDVDTGESEPLTEADVQYLKSVRSELPLFIHEGMMFSDIAFYDFKGNGKPTGI